MRKLTGHESYILSVALDLYCDYMDKEIKAGEAKGRTPIFGTSFFPMVAKEIKEKLTHLTLKKKY